MHNRYIIMACFRQYLKDNNIQMYNVNQIKVTYIEGYIQTRLSQRLGKRTLPNEMVTIRHKLKATARDKQADHSRISNHALGLSHASHQCTKVAISQENYQVIHEEALQKSPALATTLDIVVTLGLRYEKQHKAVNR